MNKLKVSKKEIRENERILGAGYCSLQYLLKYRDPFGYSVGVYGWACDYYEIEGVIISTGYSPLTNKNIKKDYELVHEYEQKAREAHESEATHEARKEKVEKLLAEFIAKVKAID